LIQIVSVTGTAGVTFLVCWFGSTLFWAWNLSFNSAVVLPGLLTYGGILGAVLLGGGARLAFNGSIVPTVPIALVTESELPSGRSFDKAADLFSMHAVLTDEIWEELSQTSKEILDNLFAVSEREALAGAKIVVWAEASGIILFEKSEALLTRGKRFARSHRIYFGLSLAVLHRESHKFENKFVMITPEGEVALDYHKRRPVPGPERKLTLFGESASRSIDTPYGRLGILICFDADFPYLARQLGREKVDILIIPSSDWQEIGEIHSQMTVFRAVENGFSIIRPARSGVSMACDPFGRVLGYLDTFSTGDRSLVVHVPIRGRRTIYSRIPVFSGN
jgi:apolipoprotein N-acyltransferase